MLEATAIYYLALAIYFESRGQPYVERLATTQVVLNRVVDERYPDSVYEVVTQGHYDSFTHQPVHNMCQFSFWCDGESDVPRDEHAWCEAILMATDALEGRHTQIIGNATHYHAVSVSPTWSVSLDKVARIGESVYYR